MEAVTRLITRKGLGSVTIKDIAREVGVTEGAVYRHFVSKQQILSYLVDQVGEFLRETVEDAESQESSALENLERIFRLQLRDIEDYWGLALIVVAGAVSFEDATLRPRVASVLNGYIERIKSILRQGVEEESLRPDLDVDAAAFTFYGMVQGLSSLWVLSETPWQPSDQGDPVWETYKRGVARVTSTTFAPTSAEVGATPETAYGLPPPPARVV
jgi:AcrR family transcriptional regulator